MLRGSRGIAAEEGGPSRRPLAVAVAAVVLALASGAAPAAAECPEKNPSYTGACGPTFVLPSWGDAGGWTKPEQYETIQLADVDGDGADELLGRTPAGLSIHTFDTTYGQWRPQVDAKDRPIVLTEFADPPPLGATNPPGTGPWWNTGGFPGPFWKAGGDYERKTDWTLPQYYDTIQAADIDGDGREEVLARSHDGLMVFKFTPSGPGRGSWQHVSTSWQLRDQDEWDAGPFYYATIGTGDFDGNGDAEVFARGAAGISILDWRRGSWAGVANIDEILSDGDGGRQPAYYTSLQAADLVGDKRDELIARDANGVVAYEFDPDTWHATLLAPSLYQRPFHDTSGLGFKDCPFYKGGPCLGAAPAYYGTLQIANVWGRKEAELFARAPDGLHGYTDPFDAQVPLGPVGALSDGSGYLDQEHWETIQFADIDGDRKAELLARGKDGLDAWRFESYQATKLTPTTPLALADDPWGEDRSYYSTIQTGDVDGDGREDVIARGPYGIRTWFYDRRGTGGWESYLPYGYSDFATAGQKAAFAALNSLARSHGYLTAAQDTVRDLWTAVTEPTVDLRTVMTNIAEIAGCPKSDDLPPRYESCPLPPGASGFTAAEWTAVVNRIVAELYQAALVMDYFHNPSNGLRVVWQGMFVERLAELQAMARELGVEAVKDKRAEFDGREAFSTILGIVGALAGAVPGGEAFAAPLEIGAEVLSALPSATESLNSEFDSTLSELDTQFAAGVSDADLTMADQSQIIRQDANLLALVSELRARGTWKLDPVAMESAGQQGFSLWVYKTLLPTMYVRYVITSCVTRTWPADDCEQDNETRARVAEPGIAKGADSRGFEMIGPPPDWGSSPCNGFKGECHYEPLPDKIAETVWGPLSDTCAYDGSTNSAVWRFDSCNVGVDPLKSVVPSAIAHQNWDFTTYSADFWLKEPSERDRVVGSARSIAGGGMSLWLRGRVRLPRPIRLRGARVTVDRLLHDTGGAGELVRGRRRRPLKLSPVRTGRASVAAFASRRKGPRVRLRLQRRSPRVVVFALRTTGRPVSLPDACSGTRRGVDLADNPIPLHTRLRIRDGRGRRYAISLRPRWHCQTNRRGAVRRLVVRPPKPLIPSRSGLAVHVRGPRRVTAGQPAAYRIVIRNRRRTPAYDVRVQATLPRGFTARRHRRARPGGDLVRWRFARLQPGRSKVLRLRARVAASAAGRGRVAVRAQAIDTRPVGRRLGTRVGAPPRWWRFTDRVDGRLPRAARQAAVGGRIRKTAGLGGVGGG